MHRFLVIAAFFLTTLSISSCDSSGAKVTVAAAASMEPLLTEMVKEFEKDKGITVEFIWGSSGSLSNKIIEGAPYDVFFSAARTFSQRVADEGDAMGAPKEFCQGQLAVIFPDTGWGIQDLLRDEVSYISIPDPKAAPYGQSAMAWLRNFPWSDQIEHKLVYTTNAAGVINHLDQGVAEVGITAESLAQKHYSEDRYLSLKDEKGFNAPTHYLLCLNDREETRKFRIHIEEFAQNEGYQSSFQDYGFQSLSVK